MGSATSASQSARPSPWAYCYDILPAVSRTFALTIPVLEGRLGDSVCVAYLLCRIADTIEDRNDLGHEQRQWLYDQFAGMVADVSGTDHARIAAFLERWPRDLDPSYQQLVEGLSEVLAAYGSLADAPRRAVNDCVQEMVGGMRTMTHQPPQDGVIYVCADLPELERYCHYVAGTVGLMLTRLFDDYMDGNGSFASTERLEQGRRFGLGLQLTNILKDHRSDLIRGTSFMPQAWLRADKDLESHQRAELLERTVAHLDEAQRYTLAVPPSQEGTRLFCLWALWMAMGTLREVARANTPKPKISRLEVGEILAYSRQYVRDDAALNKRFNELREQVVRGIAKLR